jgi:hypothetical protein
MKDRNGEKSITSSPRTEGSYKTSQSGHAISMSGKCCRNIPLRTVLNDDCQTYACFERRMRKGSYVRWTGKKGTATCQIQDIISEFVSKNRRKVHKFCQLVVQ